MRALEAPLLLLLSLALVFFRRRQLTDEFAALENEMADEAGPAQDPVQGVVAGQALQCKCRKCGGLCVLWFES